MQNMQLIDDIEEQLKQLCMPERAHNERKAIMNHFRQKVANEQAQKQQAPKKKSQPETDKES